MIERVLFLILSLALVAMAYAGTRDLETRYASEDRV